MSAVSRNMTDRTLPDAPRRRAGKTRPLVGAVALAGLVVLGTIGIVVSGRPGPTGPRVVAVKDVATETISTSTSVDGSTPPAASPEPPPPPSPLDKLYGVLPPGYNSTVCSPSDDQSPQALATVDCRELDIPDGPTSARFFLFADVNALAGQFQDGVDATEVSQCPGSIDSPRSWHYEATPDFSAGSLLCGNRDSAAVLTWTKNDVLLLGSVQGPSLDNLYGWWLSLG